MKPEDSTGLNSRQPDFTQVLINGEYEAINFYARALSDVPLKIQLQKNLKMKKINFQGNPYHHANV